MGNVVFSSIAETKNFAQFKVSKAYIKNWLCFFSSAGVSAPLYVKVSAAIVLGAWQGGTFHNNEMTVLEGLTMPNMCLR